MHQLKYLVLSSILLYASVAYANQEVILFDDFENQPPYALNTPWNTPYGVDMRYTGYEDGTQTPGVSTVKSFTGSHSFGFGNAKFNYPSVGKVELRYTLLPYANYKNRKVGFWMYVTVDSLGSIRINLDNTLIAAFNFTSTFTNKPVTTGWQYKEVNLPEWGTLLGIEMYGRNAYPQQTDPRLSNAYIDRILVTGERVSGIPSPTPEPVLLSLADARMTVEDQCQRGSGCPLVEGYESCASGALDELFVTSRIATADHEDLSDELSQLVVYCSGFAECKQGINPAELCTPFYRDGLQAGIASVDIVAIRQEGFNAGVASVDRTALIEQGRLAGFAEGVASVDVDTIREEARLVGLEEGVASVDVEGIRAAGYQEGHDAGYEEGFSAGSEGADCSADKEEARQGGYNEGYLAGLLTKKITICHHVKKKQQTITISRDALEAHLKHGDTLGPCTD